MEQKVVELLKYSNPKKVLKNAIKYLGKDVDVYVSTRKNKKYMIRSPEGKWIHFGLFGMEDYTKHLSEDRRSKFKQRNARWSRSPKWSAGWMSYHLLW